MNIIVLAIVVTGIIFLIHNLVKRYNQATDSDAYQEEAHQRFEDESRRFAEDSPFVPIDGISCLPQHTERTAKPVENVTSSPTSAANQSRCPACGAIITANDERCPSCEISFVTDGTSFITDAFQRRTSRAMGPADGIHLPPTEFRK